MENEGIHLFALVILALAGMGLLSIGYIGWKLLRALQALLAPTKRMAEQREPRSASLAEVTAATAPSIADETAGNWMK